VLSGVDPRFHRENERQSLSRQAAAAPINIVRVLGGVADFGRAFESGRLSFYYQGRQTAMSERIFEPRDGSGRAIVLISAGVFLATSTWFSGTADAFWPLSAAYMSASPSRTSTSAAASLAASFACCALSGIFFGAGPGAAHDCGIQEAQLRVPL
jgi:hypothetical protein